VKNRIAWILVKGKKMGAFFLELGAAGDRSTDGTGADRAL
jgi:hypothetical protein